MIIKTVRCPSYGGVRFIEVSVSRELTVVPIIVHNYEYNLSPEFEEINPGCIHRHTKAMKFG